jgi:hypothetical protein
MKEFSLLLRNLNFHHSYHRSPPLDTIPVPVFITNFCVIHSNITFSSIPMSLKWFLLTAFHNQTIFMSAPYFTTLAVIQTTYMVSSDWIILNNDLKWCARKGSWPKIRVLSRYLRGRTGGNPKILNQDSKCPGQISNRAPPQYKSEAPPTVKFLSYPLLGRAIAQAVNRWLPTAAARVRSQAKWCGICGGQSAIGADFLRVLQFPLPIFIPPNAPYSSIIRDWYGRPISGRRANWTHPTPRILK